MTPIVDSHIHLFRTVDIPDLSWQSPSGPLYASHDLEEYASAIDPDVRGFIFVETDRRYSDPITTVDDAECWKHVLEEYEYVLDTSKTSDKVLGIVPWAPIHLGAKVLERYGRLLEKIGGREKKLVVGYRYLLQDKPLATYNDEKFIEGLKWVKGQDKVFDLGVDVHSGGIEQLEQAVKMCAKVEGLKLVINHLTKPPLGTQPTAQWATWLSQLAASSTATMKLSGAFSELPLLQNFDEDEIAELAKPWARAVFEMFGPKRVMWGSDWPVCGIGYGKIVGEQKGAWKAWRKISEKIVGELEKEFVSAGKGTKEDWEGVWERNALVAYGIEQ